MNENFRLSLALVVLAALVSACTAKEETDEPSTGTGGSTPTPTPAPMTTQGNFRIIFVTDTEVNGSGAVTGLGSGLTSFDALCASEMTAKGFGGTFKALVYTTNRRPGGSDWVLRLGKEYRREDLTTVIDVAENDATAGGVIFPMIATPLANPITSSIKLPWTGFENDWTSSYDCSGWTRNDFDNTSSTLGTYGKSSINTDTELVDLGYT